MQFTRRASQPCSRPQTTGAYRYPLYFYSSSHPRQLVRASAPQGQPASVCSRKLQPPQGQYMSRTGRLLSPAVHWPLRSAPEESTLQTDEGQRPQERLEERLGKLERDVLRVQKGQDALRKEVGDFQEKLSTAVLVLKNSVDQLAEAETQRSPRLQRGLSSSSSRDTGSKLTLRTLSDLLDLVLPKAVKDVVFLTPGLRDAIASAVLQPLLEKDIGVLRAVEVLLDGEGLHWDADPIRQLQERGCGVSGKKDAAEVRSRLKALMQDLGWNLSPRLIGDVGRLLEYLDARRDEERRELLKSELFVRCAAAVLCGGCMGVLEVEAGAAGACCEYNEVTQVLQVKVGARVKRAHDDAIGGLGCDGLTEGYMAEQLLKDVGAIAAYTLDRALVAVHSAAASGTLLLPQGLTQDLPSRLFVHGVIRHVGEGTHTQQQQAGGQRKRMELLGGEVISSGKPGGLEGATLVLTTVGAGRS